MSQFSTRLKAAAAAGLATAGIAGAALAVTASSQAQAPAPPNANTYECHGNLTKGPKADPITGGHTVRYQFACPGPITGYQIQPQVGYESFGTDAVVTKVDGTNVPTDSFTCNGDYPGVGFNCVGTYLQANALVTGTFTVANPIYQEPRPDALLTVTYATADKTGKVTQYIAGPFDLGRPQGGPKTKNTGSSRIPYVNKAEAAGLAAGAGAVITHHKSGKSTTKPKATKKAESSKQG